MAIIKESPLGVISGKIGQIVGSTWKGINYVRGCQPVLPTLQTDTQIGSAAEVLSHHEFSSAPHRISPLGFKSYAVGMSGINAGMNYNIKNGLTGSYPNIAIDYPNALVARGNLAGSLNAVASSTVAGTGQI